LDGLTLQMVNILLLELSLMGFGSTFFD
jgi:hypothetical protein